jgi:hypothetical protein
MYCTTFLHIIFNLLFAFLINWLLTIILSFDQRQKGRCLIYCFHFGWLYCIFSRLWPINSWSSPKSSCSHWPHHFSIVLDWRIPIKTTHGPLIMSSLFLLIIGNMNHNWYSSYISNWLNSIIFFNSLIRIPLNSLL